VDRGFVATACSAARHLPVGASWGAVSVDSPAQPKLECEKVRPPQRPMSTHKPIDQNVSSFRTDWRSLLRLLFMPSSAALSVVAVEIYLGVGVRPLTMVMVAALALFIYALNGLSDGAEDSVNNRARATALRRSAAWTLGGSLLAMMASGAALAVRGRLLPLYPIVMLIGVAYSFRVIPSPWAPGGGWVRLKDVPLVKNLTIACTWTAAVFLAPLLDAGASSRMLAGFAFLALTYALLIAENSIYSDLRDEVGDRQAGIRTLATYLGARRVFAATFVVAALWAVSIMSCFVRGLVDGPTATFLIVATVGYPSAVWLATRRFVLPRELTHALIEAIDLFFAAGMIALSASA
jgi:4-hydroxybenzoate polyprenyltransferase